MITSGVGSNAINSITCIHIGSILLVCKVLSVNAEDIEGGYDVGVHYDKAEVMILMRDGVSCLQPFTRRNSAPSHTRSCLSHAVFNWQLRSETYPRLRRWPRRQDG